MRKPFFGLNTVQNHIPITQPTQIRTVTKVISTIVQPKRDNKIKHKKKGLAYSNVNLDALDAFTDEFLTADND